ncbi:MAG TPA: hypothetical protein VGK89_01770 [Candidatus Eisenbacteria bacterium]|jgi:photosystem II stability/assembly factor-like uncharacterized protein
MSGSFPHLVRAGPRWRVAPTLVLLFGALGLAAPAGAATLFGLVDTGELYASASGGASWTIRSTLPVRDAVALIAGASSSELFLASESGSIYRSTDAGTSWAAVGTVPASDVAALLGSPGRLQLLTRSGSVYNSTNNGATWTAVGAITASDVVGVARIDAVELALTMTGSVYRSTDNGASWGAVGTLVVSDAVAIVVFGGEPWVITSTGDLAKSNDAGASWSIVGTLSQVGITSLAASSTELIASTEGGEVAASADGVSWTWRGVIGQLTMRALGSDVPTTTSVEPGSPRAGVLLAPWPNPARDGFHLAIELEHEALVTVTVYDAAGRLAARPIAPERLPAGRIARVWRPSDLPRGSYYLRASIGGRVQSRRVTWLGP